MNDYTRCQCSLCREKMEQVHVRMKAALDGEKSTGYMEDFVGPVDLSLDALDNM